MRRVGFPLLYWIAGLITTWLACWIGLRLPSGGDGCHEIDLCSPPWPLAALRIGFLLGPSLGFAFAGWRMGRRRATRQTVPCSLSTLVTPTMLFFLASYVIR
jgi:hypothetical protein